MESGAPDSCLLALTAATQSPEPGGTGAEGSEGLGRRVRRKVRSTSLSAPAQHANYGTGIPGYKPGFIILWLSDLRQTT